MSEFELEKFFPYQVRIYYRCVSDAVSNAYTKSYDLNVSEWRTMAVLGANASLSATEIVARSSMDKVTVSRAIKGLQNRQFLRRSIDENDRRRVALQLTGTGKDAFSQMVPLAKELSSKCLDGLTPDEQEMLVSLMRKVRKNAEKIHQAQKKIS